MNIYKLSWFIIILILFDLQKIEITPINFINGNFYYFILLIIAHIHPKNKKHDFLRFQLNLFLILFNKIND